MRALLDKPAMNAVKMAARRRHHQGSYADVNHGLLLRIVLAWVLVLQPVGAVMHAWSHFDGATQHQDDGQSNAHAACELCVAYAHAGAALPGSGMQCPVVTTAVPLPDVSQPSLSSTIQAAYLARAPPHDA